VRIPTFDEVDEKIRFCVCCRLSESRTRAVPGAGSRRARIVLVGEGPGREEDLSGLPFVGAAGKFLDRLLDLAGLTRDEVYITNIVKCRPPANRDPLPDEMDSCSTYLRYQLRALSPELVVAMGNFAFRRLAGRTNGISRARGTFFSFGGRRLYAVYHPAAVLYNPGLKSIMEEDFTFLARALREGAAAR
jgi:DNA polymerase